MRQPKLHTIILTGGIASRMRPLSFDRAKTMIPFMGHPLLSFLFQLLQRAGITEIALSSPGRNNEITECFGDGANQDLLIHYFNIAFSHGTAGAVKIITDKLGAKSGDTILILYGDSLLRADIKGMIDSHLERRADCTILFHRPVFESFLYENSEEYSSNSDPRTNYGVMNITSKERIDFFEEKPKLTDIGVGHLMNPVANAAVYLIKWEHLQTILDDAFVDFPRHLFPQLLNQGMTCYGYNIGDGFRIDIGTIRNYLHSHLQVFDNPEMMETFLPELRNGIITGARATIDSSCTLSKPYLIGEDARIGPKCRIHRSFIGSRVNIGAQVEIEDSIVLDGATIGTEVVLRNSIVGEFCSIAPGATLPKYSVVGSYSRLGGDIL